MKKVVEKVKNSAVVSRGNGDDPEMDIEEYGNQHCSIY